MWLQLEAAGLGLGRDRLRQQMPEFRRHVIPYAELPGQLHGMGADSMERIAVAGARHHHHLLRFGGGQFLEHR